MELMFSGNLTVNQIMKTRSFFKLKLGASIKKSAVKMRINNNADILRERGGVLQMLTSALLGANNFIL